MVILSQNNLCWCLLRVHSRSTEPHASALILVAYTVRYFNKREPLIVLILRSEPFASVFVLNRENICHRRQEQSKHTRVSGPFRLHKPLSWR
ncbi:hypothetical protein BDZ89DRAFT_411884 [Hymenopellis radicata]|nr:hypothetical protein BDZ89DRAFT_411884 [Hymenopellis radicata]